MRKGRRNARQRARLVGRWHPDLIAMLDEVGPTRGRSGAAEIAATCRCVAAGAAATLGSTTDSVGIAEAGRGRVVTSDELIRRAGRILRRIRGRGGITG